MSRGIGFIGHVDHHKTMPTTALAKLAALHPMDAGLAVVVPPSEAVSVAVEAHDDTAGRRRRSR